MLTVSILLLCFPLGKNLEWADSIHDLTSVSSLPAVCNSDRCLFEFYGDHKEPSLDPHLLEVIEQGVQSTPMLIGNLNNSDSIRVHIPKSRRERWIHRSKLGIQSVTEVETSRSTDLKFSVSDASFFALGQIWNQPYMVLSGDPTSETSTLVIDHNRSRPALSNLLRNRLLTQDIERAHIEYLLADARSLYYPQRTIGALERLRYYHPVQFASCMEELLRRRALPVEHFVQYFAMGDASYNVAAVTSLIRDYAKRNMIDYRDLAYQIIQSGIERKLVGISECFKGVDIREYQQCGARPYVDSSVIDWITENVNGQGVPARTRHIQG